jgi:hypothetical protein
VALRSSRYFGVVPYPSRRAEFPATRLASTRFSTSRTRCAPNARARSKSSKTRGEATISILVFVVLSVVFVVSVFVLSVFVLFDGVAVNAASPPPRAALPVLDASSRAQPPSRRIARVRALASLIARLFSRTKSVVFVFVVVSLARAFNIIFCFCFVVIIIVVVVVIIRAPPPPPPLSSSPSPSSPSPTVDARTLVVGIDAFEHINTEHCRAHTNDVVHDLYFLNIECDRCVHDVVT